MNIILTYDPRWEHTPDGHTPSWASIDSVEYVAELLEETGNTVLPIEAGEELELRLREVRNKYAEPLVFWLNEFVPTDYGRDRLTVSVLEKLRLMHTGPDAKALGIGLDKEKTKDVFRKLGLPTPDSYVVYPGDYSPIFLNTHWDGYVIIKPLLQGSSKGIDEYSVLNSDGLEKILHRVRRIHHEFNEPALVERYIGGENSREITVPFLITHDGRTAKLPIAEIDLSRIRLAQGRFRFLTREIKHEGYGRKIPADLPSEVAQRVYSDVGRFINEVGCRDMARVDMRVDSTGLYYIEVNVNPSKSRKNSSTTASAYSLGLNYREIIAFIPYQAMLKYGLEPPRKLEELVEPVVALFDTPPTIAMVA